MILSATRFSHLTNGPKTKSMEREPEAVSRLVDQIRHGEVESRQSLPEWLEGQIKLRGWARWRVAESLGVSQRTLGRWLNGTLPPRRRDLDRLAQVFGQRAPLNPSQ